VPRVLNAALAVFLLSFLTPLVGHFGERSRLAQVVVVLLAAPVLLVALVCALAAARPGALGRAVRRRRRAR